MKKPERSAPDPQKAAGAARQWYARSHQGILSTISLEVAGYPFGSVIAFAPDHGGRPLILISRIAEHTRNLEADPRVSLILTEQAEDAQAAGRLTLVGRAAPVPADEEGAAAARYYRRFPHAEHYHRAHDFGLFRIEPLRIRYIGGFGDIHWLEPRDVCRPNPFSAGAENGMTQHMNSDHADALRGYCQLYGVETNGQAPRLAAIDAEGFDLMVGKKLVRIEFEQPVQSADEVRKAMVALALRARDMGVTSARRQ